MQNCESVVFYSQRPEKASKIFDNNFFFNLELAKKEDQSKKFQFFSKIFYFIFVFFSMINYNLLKNFKTKYKILK